MVTLPLIKGTNLVHLGKVQFKVKDLLVTLNPRFVDRLWKDDDPFLVFKPEDNLSGILTVLVSHLGDHRFLQQVSVSLAQWCLGFQDHVIFRHQLTKFLLLKVRVEFNLVDCHASSALPYG